MYSPTLTGPPDVTRGSHGSALAEIVRAIAPLGLTAFGGPQAHIGLLQRELVERRGWTDDRTFAELLGLCSLLPGPTSTQMIIGLGALRAGLPGALLALLVWMFPAALIASLGGIGLAHEAGMQTPLWLLGAQPAAVALVALAAWTLGRRLVTDHFTAAMLGLGAIGTLLWSSPFAFPIVLLLAGLIAWRVVPLSNGPPDTATNSQPRTPLIDISRTTGIGALLIFVALLLALPVLRAITGWRPLAWVELFYRAGSLVFGGGQVLIGVLLGDVTGPGWIGRGQFLSGLSLVQALPGPFFSIGGFTGGVLGGVSGALLCLVAIFLPGLLLMIGLLPFWESLRNRPAIRSALLGVNACAVGLIVTALYQLYGHAVHGRVDAALLVAALGAAGIYRVPAPLVIVAAALIGWPLHSWLG